MDIKKVQEVVENSQLSDEAKDLIYKMLPEADKPEVKEEIMKVIDYEIRMNDALADEGEEILKKIDDGDKMVDATEGVVDEEMQDLNKEADEKLASLKAEEEEVEEDINKLSSDEGPTEPMAESVVEPVMTEPVSEPAVEPVAEPMAPVTPAWQQPATPVADPASQWNQPVVEQPAEPVAPVQAAPSWDQVAEQPVAPATQPAPFPGTQVGQ